MVKTAWEIKICESACECCVEALYSKLKECPGMLEEMEKIPFVDTHLHRAAAAGNTGLAMEIMNLMPSLSKKLNPQGLSPLHVAVGNGHVDTAEALARFDKQLVRVKGKGGLTPMHYAATMHGLEILATLLIACPDSITDLNNKYQTVIHVALENHNCRAVSLLVDWLRRTERISLVLSVKDVDGNTALHAAARYGCAEGARQVMKLVKLNKVNSESKTALDIAEKFGQKEVAEDLKNAGAKRRSEILTSPMTDYVKSPATLAEHWLRVYYFLTKELTLEMRSAILVVAVLIITATYQGVLQPPGGIYPPVEGGRTPGRATWEIGRQPRARPISHVQRLSHQEHLTGKMVMEETHYSYFMPANTFAFTLSTVIIIFIAPGSPIFLVLHLCLIFMCLGYLLALNFISPYNDTSKIIFILAWVTLIIAFFVKLLYYPVKAVCIEEDWWLRGFGVRIDNCCRRTGGKLGNKIIEFTETLKRQYEVLDLKK